MPKLLGDNEDVIDVTSQVVRYLAISFIVSAVVFLSGVGACAYGAIFL